MNDGFIIPRCRIAGANELTVGFAGNVRQGSPLHFAIAGRTA